MASQLRTLFGVALVLLGALLAIGVIPLATVIYDTTPPTIVSAYPSGTSSSPTPVAVGTMTVSADVGDNVATPNDIIVKCRITSAGGGFDTTLNLPIVPGSAVSIGGMMVGHYETTWSVPAIAIYTFTFTATDPNGNVRTLITYAESGDPDGKFYINGVEVSPSSVIRVKSSDLTIKFVATSLGSLINKVEVKVTKSSTKVTSLPCTVSGQTWEGTVSLTEGEGQYIVEGWIYWGSKSGRKMSIVMGFGSMEPPVAINGSLVVGAIMAVAGACLILTRKK
jgi:hypothetical protein